MNMMMKIIMMIIIIMIMIMMMRAQKKSANIKVISSPISGKFVSICVMTARNFAYVHHFFILRKITQKTAH